MSMEGGGRVSPIRPQMAVTGAAGRRSPDRACEPAGALQGAGGPVSDRSRARVRALVLWGALAAVLLALALGASLQQGLLGGHSAASPALRFGAASHPRGTPRTRGGAPRASGAARAGARTGLGIAGRRRARAITPLALGAGAYGAANAAQRMTLRFDRSGVALASATARVDLSVRAAGYGGSLRAPWPGSAPRKANRVAYSHPASANGM